MQKKLILIVLAVAVIGASVWGYAQYRGGDKAPEIVQSTITRGDIVEAVGATGTLEAVTTVQVGSQVSGTVQALHADFNSIVRRGQVIARLDPSLLQTQIEQQSANVVRAQADLERLRVGLDDARTKLNRARELAERSLIPRTELEAAEIAVRSQEAQIRSSEAGLTQARANLQTARVNMNHTVITAPIDGIVISRNVDEGQTVAASMNAPVLFLLAADLTKMKVSANIDEADVGKIRPGQRVTFRVDAYPTGEFEGTVVQVRLNPVTVQNVVTYATVIEVPNLDLRLKPGMTANVNIEIARRDNVLRIPAGAMRFRPTADTFAALGQVVPPEAVAGGRGGRGGRGARGDGANDADGRTAAASAAPGTAAAPANMTAPPTQGTSVASAPQSASAAPGAPAPAADGGAQGPRQGQTAESRGGGDTARGERGGRGGDSTMTPEEREKRMQERLAAMTPEEREAFQKRMAERGQGAGFNRAGGRGQGAGEAAGRTPQAAPGAQSTAQRRTPAPAPERRTAASQRATTSGAQTIDALFAPLATTSARGRVWMVTGTPTGPQLKSIAVRTGITDGQWIELIEGELQEGQEVVTGVVLANATAQVPGNTGANPLMGPQRGNPSGRGR